MKVKLRMFSSKFNEILEFMEDDVSYGGDGIYYVCAVGLDSGKDYDVFFRKENGITYLENIEEFTNDKWK